MSLKFKGEPKINFATHVKVWQNTQKISVGKGLTGSL
jgi:hypothetical protein